MTQVFKYKKHHPDARIDSPAKVGDAGYDVYAVEERYIPEKQSREINVGLSFEPPEGYYFSIATRSKHGISNDLQVHPGTVDNGYRGILKIKLYNHGNIGYTVSNGEKIAQLILKKLEVFPLLEVPELSASQRGEAGFGSTDK